MSWNAELLGKETGMVIRFLAFEFSATISCIAWRQTCGGSLFSGLSFFLNLLFRNSLRLTGSCKNSTEWTYPNTELSPLISYITSVRFQKQKIDIGLILLTTLQPLLRFHQLFTRIYFISEYFEPMLICNPFLLGRSGKDTIWIQYYKILKRI